MTLDRTDRTTLFRPTSLTNDENKKIQTLESLAYEIMKYRVNPKNIDNKFKDVFEIKNREIEEYDRFID